MQVGTPGLIMIVYLTILKSDWWIMSPVQISSLASTTTFRCCFSSVELSLRFDLYISLTVVVITRQLYRNAAVGLMNEPEARWSEEELLTLDRDPVLFWVMESVIINPSGVQVSESTDRQYREGWNVQCEQSVKTSPGMSYRTRLWSQQQLLGTNLQSTRMELRLFTASRFYSNVWLGTWCTVWLVETKVISWWALSRNWIETLICI